MRYFEKLEDGYILAIGQGNGHIEIDEERYNEILDVIHNKPPRTETTDFRLRLDLTWEEYDVPPEPEPEPDDHDKAEAYDILVGGAT